MPLVNVIRGERIEPAPFNIRTPYIRVPLWLLLAFWTVKGGYRLAVVYVRYWYVTVPVTGLGWLYLRYGWPGPAIAAGAPVLGFGVWALVHWPSCRRFGWWPILGRWRRLRYRRRWHPAMVTAGLAVTFDGHTILPVLKRVRVGPTGDTLTIRMVTGQIPDDYAKVGERLTHTFSAQGCKVDPRRAAGPGPTRHAPGRPAPSDRRPAPDHGRARLHRAAGRAARGRRLLLPAPVRHPGPRRRRDRRRQGLGHLVPRRRSRRRSRGRASSSCGHSTPRAAWNSARGSGCSPGSPAPTSRPWPTCSTRRSRRLRPARPGCGASPASTSRPWPIR